MTTSSSPDFYLASTEGYGLEDPRDCFVLRHTKTANGRHGVLVRVSPAITRASGTLAQVLLFPRHAGERIVPPSNWPIAVYVCTTSGSLEEIPESIPVSNVENFAWAELYPTRHDAACKTITPLD